MLKRYKNAQKLTASGDCKKNNMNNKNVHVQKLRLIKRVVILKAFEMAENFILFFCQTYQKNRNRTTGICLLLNINKHVV